MAALSLVGRIEISCDVIDESSAARIAGPANFCATPRLYMLFAETGAALWQSDRTSFAPDRRANLGRNLTQNIRTIGSGNKPLAIAFDVASRPLAQLPGANAPASPRAVSGKSRRNSADALSPLPIRAARAS